MSAYRSLKRSNGRPFEERQIARRFKSFNEENNLTPVVFHSLRHTYTSLMIANNVPIVEVSSQLGHARSSTTTNIYGHVIASAHAKTLTTNRFNDVLMPPEKSDDKR